MSGWKTRKAANDYQRDYMSANPDKRAAHRDWQRQREYAHRVWLHEYFREHHCVDCGEADPIILEFDHLRANKRNRDVASMGQASRERVLREIARCEVVCSNCHTRRTAKRANSIRW